MIILPFFSLLQKSNSDFWCSVEKMSQLIQEALNCVFQTEEDKRGVLEWALTTLTLVRDSLREERGQDSLEGSSRSGLSANHNGSLIDCNWQQASLGFPNVQPPASLGGLEQTEVRSPASLSGPDTVEPTATHWTPSQEDRNDDGQEVNEGCDLLSKRQKITIDNTRFDPSSLVTAKEGTFVAHSTIVEYLDTHLKKYLTNEERDGLKKDHPKPSTDSRKVPIVDKYIKEFLGARFPNTMYWELARIQGAVLQIINPLASA